MPGTRAPAGVVVVAGGGLSKAGAVPTEAADGRFRGVPIPRIATAATWREDPELVRSWFDAQRLACATSLPNAAHEVLARLQHALGVRRCTLATWNLDGLLQKASAEDVIELRGSVFRLRCDAHADHPRSGLFGPQPRDRRCARCGGPLRPDVIWREEPPTDLPRLLGAIDEAELLLIVGASPDRPTLHRSLERARDRGVRTVEVNVAPTGDPRFDEAIAEPAEIALPRICGAWLGE